MEEALHLEQLSDKPCWEGGISAKLKGNKGANHFIVKGGEFLNEERKSTKAQRWEHPWLMEFSKETSVVAEREVRGRAIGNEIKDI